MARRIDGTKIAAEIKGELVLRVQELAKVGVVPHIAVIMVGSRPDSATYVRMKERAAREVGVEFSLFKFDEGVGEEELKEKVEELNNNHLIHGILVQLPLPSSISEIAVTGRISSEKDVDGLHAHNIGKLALKGFTPPFISCTPKGCIELLNRMNIPIAGKDAVVVGRSNIVGVPISLLLLENDATVTICHSKTENLAEKVRSADIVIAAVGRPLFVKGDWIKPGAVVIDVGINSVDDPSRASGFRLVGDVDYQEAVQRASFITPVPGGVGPMTVVMLLENTVKAAELSASSHYSTAFNTLQ